MSTVVIEVRYRTAAIALSRRTVWIRSTLSEEMKCAMGAATQAGADARGCSVTIITGRRTAHFEDPACTFSPEDNSIPALMRRGVVFMSCHNAIWEQAAALIKRT